MSAWFASFRERVASARFFARFIDGLDPERQRNYTCLFHHDLEPSMSIDPIAGVFNCFGCHKQGGILEFFAAIKGYELDDDDQRSRCIEALCTEFDVDVAAVSCGSGEPVEDAPADVDLDRVRAALAAARERAAVPPRNAPAPIPDEIPAAMTLALWSDSGQRARRFLLENRGLTEGTLRAFELGWDLEHKRISFPIRDEVGSCRNIGLYSPDSSDKFISYGKGYGRPRLWPLHVITDATTVVLAEGQVDALSAIQNGVPAVTTTGGAMVDWRKHPELADPLRGKYVIIAYDRDTWDTGESPVPAIARVLLERGALEVRALAWPDAVLAACGGEKADINDFFVKGGGTGDGFRALLEAAKPVLIPQDDQANEAERGGDGSDAPGGSPASGTAPAASTGSTSSGATAQASPGSARLMNALWSLYFYVSKRGVVSGLKGVPITLKAQTLIDHVAGEGAQFFYFVDADDAVFVVGGRAHIVMPEDEAFRQFWHREVKLFGMNRSEGKELIEAVGVAVTLHPTCVRVERANWGHLDWKSGVLYVCLDPTQATIVKVEPANGGTAVVKAVPNGTDGVLLRCPTYRTTKFHYQPDPGGPAAGLQLFRDLVHAQQALDEVDRIGSTSFNLAALLPGLEQRPIKFHNGGEHSGKTTASQDVEIVLYGKKRAAGFNQPQELWAAVDSAGPIVTFDNAESRARAKFGDTFNRMATGISQTFRKLFFNRKIVEYHPNATLVLTAIESFSMPEEIDRAIEFTFDVRHHDRAGRAPRTEQMRAIAAHSDAMLSALLEVMSIAVLPDLEMTIGRAQAFIAKKRPHHSKSRFDEYLAVMLIWMEAIGGMLWDQRRDDRVFDASAIFLEFLDRQRDAHERSVVASSPEVRFLDAIRLGAGDDGYNKLKLPGVPITHTSAGACTIGPVTGGVLFTAFSLVARASGLRMEWQGPQQLGQRLGAAARNGGALALGGWTRSAAGTAHNNNPLYRYVYTPPIHVVAAPLTVVPPDGAAKPSNAAPVNGTPVNGSPRAPGDHLIDDAAIGDWLTGGKEH